MFGPPSGVPGVAFGALGDPRGPLGGFLGDCAGSWGRLGRPLDSKALRGRLWSDSREIPGDSWEPAGAHFGVILSFIVVSILCFLGLISLHKPIYLYKWGGTIEINGHNMTHMSHLSHNE